MKLPHLLALVLITAIGYWIWSNVEKIPVAEHGISTAHGMAAAEALLSRRDLPVRRISSAAELFPLPSPDTLLILQRRDARMAEWQRKALLEWLQAGGRLIVNSLPMDYNDYIDDQLGDDDINSHDPLLYALGVTAWHSDSVARRPALPTDTSDGDQLEFRFRLHCLGKLDLDGMTCARIVCGEDRLPDYALFDDDQTLWQLELDPQIDLLHRDLYSTPQDDDPKIPLRDTSVIGRGSSNGGHDMLLWLEAGKGDVLVFSDLDIFSNMRLHHLDHADLLLALTRGSNAVWWIRSVDAPALHHWLWQRGWPLICAATLLLLLFLWHRIPRRGVMLQSADIHERDFTDHFQAASALLWRIGQPRALLEPLRRDVMRQLSRHPGGSDPARHIEIATTLTNLSATEVKNAMQQVPANEAELHYLISLLQHLRQWT
jgi:hypothetical protein